MQHVGISHSVLIGVVSFALLEGRRNERREDMELMYLCLGFAPTWSLLFLVYSLAKQLLACKC